MKLIILSSVDFPEDFPWDEFTQMIIADTGSLEDFPAEEANRVPTQVVTASADEIPENLLNQVSDVIEDEDPVAYVISRGIPGDVALFAYDDSDESYRVLERLNKQGVTVLDTEDDYVEVSIDQEMSMEDLIETITQRVTADVLRIVRQELADTPRRARFRSPAPRA
jgi:Fe-S cluster assembly scaffold protein SufB